MKNNFLIKQYVSDKKMRIKHNYFSEQFKNTNKNLNSIKDIVRFIIPTEILSVDKMIEYFIVVHCFFVVGHLDTLG